MVDTKCITITIFRLFRLLSYDPFGCHPDARKGDVSIARISGKTLSTVPTLTNNLNALHQEKGFFLKGCLQM